MKRAMTLLTALVMVFSLPACGNKTENEMDETVFQSASPETDKTAFEPVPLVNLWTTTCSYCIEEMPVLEELRKEFQEQGVRFNIISVCMDIGSTEAPDDANLKKAKEIIEKTGVSYTNLLPDSVLLEGRLEGIQAFPESFFVDSQGNVVSEPYVGAMPKNHWRVTMKNEIDRMAQDKKED